MARLLSAFLVLALATALPAPAAEVPGPLDVPKAPPPGWWPDPCAAHAPPAEGIGAKQANVVVVTYDPVIETEGGKRLTAVLKWNDPAKLTRDVIETVRAASGGFLNYRVVKQVDLDRCPPFLSGFRYDDAGILEAVRSKKWIKGDRSSYAAIFAEAGIDRAFVEKENVTEVWLWGSPGFHWDEYAMRIPDRAKRLPPTDNPWFYRPYDVPDLGRTLWVMGWSYERGLDCALESYTHRCEGILALVMGNGKWDKALAGKDPWNTWSMTDADFPGRSGCGCVHVPPNGQKGYDFGNAREVESACEDWTRWPACDGRRVRVDGTQWDRNGAGFQAWWMGHVPRNPGRTAWGWNNWWIYVADFDGTLEPLPAAR
jgi:hypothetical protein